MDSKLMNTFTNEQLLMCEKETLINYINDIKKEIPVKILTDSYEILEKFISEECKETDNITQKNGKEVAPTSFDDLFYEFNWWCICQGFRRMDKKKTKILFLQHQKFSKYGLDLGQTIKDGRPNGSERKLYLNLVWVDGEAQEEVEEQVAV